MSRKITPIRANPSAKIYFLINEYLLNPISLPLTGEGTHIKYTGGFHWAHIKLKIYKTDDLLSTTLTWSNSETNFPEKYENEIIKALETFLIHFEGLTGKKLDVSFEILEANYREGETGSGNFYYAIANSILNAFDKSLHEPNIEAVRRYKNSR